MDTHKFIQIFEQLTSTQNKILRKLLVGETDEQIANSFHIEKSTVRKHVQNICKAFELQKDIDKQYSKRAKLVALFSKHKPELINPNEENSTPKNSTTSTVITPKIDWGEAPNISVFYGRNNELNTLSKFILDDQCNLVAVLGMGGMGKTTLASKLAQEICSQFDYIIWRSLREAPKIKDILADIIKFISNQQEIILPDTLGGTITRLIHYLKASKCLLILDNVESIMQSGNYVGEYLADYEGYGDLFTRIGESNHQSCLLITSREKPQKITLLEAISAVSSLQLIGLNISAGQNILAKHGSLFGSENEWKAVIQAYAGNPQALIFAAVEIKEALNGNISTFVANYLNKGQVIFKDIRELLESQFQRLSDLEKNVMYWLAINREPFSILELQEDIISSLPQLSLLEALASLLRREFIEKSNGDKFSLQNVIMEYMTDKLIREVWQEIQTENIQLLNSHALIKAQSKDYVREAQIRLILNPIKEKLLLVNHNTLNHLLIKQKQKFYRIPGYFGGNIVNLLSQLFTDFTNYDFSNLAIWQAYLKDITLHNVNFTHSDLSKSVFAETLSRILTVAFSPNGQKLVSGSNDQTIRLWDITTGKCLKTLIGHEDWIWWVTFSPDGGFLLSSSDDRTVKIWDANSGECLETWQPLSSWIWSMVLSPNGKILATGDDDYQVRLWDIDSKQCQHICIGHSLLVQALAFSHNGKTLASGSDDGMVRLWDVNTGQFLQEFEGHSRAVRAIAYSPDDQLLASSSDDQTIRVWDFTLRNTVSFTEHTQGVESLSFSPQDPVLASSSEDETIKIWDLQRDECRKTLKIHRLYEGMNITHATGFNQAQQETMIVLGATRGTA
ncbi:NB-ARC domain-containing protein [Dolichospermum sp. ST_con]|nr:NB-ARC domain-containing protein [Dolichospermum sp. ST_con]MDD1418475.1 NB-ARC domain-containing protein [Dolichospermum sp. ST_sed1]MDD1424580.1 NB-ARC domain-containing protein [Dolichospermum sp. ST_sed9]MDD1432071.1 NB-ARC domain-containing protein [Dolichospermum sp. ST_sed6]MDD1441493.1 NB-ARC domain-containing protein [Dolichospermum sp. ST_sed3]MDD1447164.1 NB-ARC domain-containing protein [Dolichospermum sp. ST_sed8]MDD1455615.1 NB-ARC domain-containing protein [Dolichospermum sp